MSSRRKIGFYLYANLRTMGACFDWSDPSIPYKQLLTLGDGLFPMAVLIVHGMAHNGVTSEGILALVDLLTDQHLSECIAELRHLALTADAKGFVLQRSQVVSRDGKLTRLIQEIAQ